MNCWPGSAREEGPADRIRPLGTVARLPLAARHRGNEGPGAGVRWQGSGKREDGAGGGQLWARNAPLEQRQVEQAWEEARELSDRPSIVLFAAFQFDPEAAKDIDELDPTKTKMLFLRSQMNTDLLTEDLKKKRASNESFWLIGQPDVELRAVKKGDHKGQWQVAIRGFDYYNPAKGTIESGDASHGCKGSYSRLPATCSTK